MLLFTLKQVLLAVFLAALAVRESGADFAQYLSQPSALPQHPVKRTERLKFDLTEYTQQLEILLSERAKPRSARSMVEFTLSRSDERGGRVVKTVKIPEAVLFANSPRNVELLAILMIKNPRFPEFVTSPQAFGAAYDELKRIHRLLIARRSSNSPLVLRQPHLPTQKITFTPSTFIIEPGLVFQDYVTQEEAREIFQGMPQGMIEELNQRRPIRFLGLGDRTGAVAFGWKRLFGTHSGDYQILHHDSNAIQWATHEAGRNWLQFKKGNLLALSPEQEERYDLIYVHELLSLLTDIAPEGENMDAKIFDSLIRMNQLLVIGGFLVSFEDLERESERNVKLRDLAPIFHLSSEVSYHSDGIMKISGYQVDVFRKTGELEIIPLTAPGEGRAAKNQGLGKKAALDAAGVLRINTLEKPTPSFQQIPPRFRYSLGMFGNLFRKAPQEEAKPLQRSL